MLVKDKDILVQDNENNALPQGKETPKRKPVVRIDKENMSSAWGDAFDAYLRGITENYLMFRNRSTRIEFWGYMTAAGMVWLPIYLLGSYVDMPMLPYYYALATFIPTLAITARRLHDTNKNALLFLGILPILALSGLLIKWYALIPVMLYLAFLIKLLFAPTDETVGFYGPAKENDETYGDDTIRILKKFRMFAIVLTMMCCTITASGFDDWSRQSQRNGIRAMIEDEILKVAGEEKLSQEQINQATELMNTELKKMNGQDIQIEDLLKQVDTVVKGVSED